MSKGKGLVEQLCAGEREDKELITEITSGKYDDSAINEVDEDGFTPLMLAVMTHSVELCEALISKGANVAIKDAEANTLLHIAALWNRGNQIIDLLLDQKIKVGAINADGKTAIELALYKANINFLQGIGLPDTVLKNVIEAKVEEMRESVVEMRSGAVSLGAPDDNEPKSSKEVLQTITEEVDTVASTLDVAGAGAGFDDA